MTLLSPCYTQTTEQNRRVLVAQWIKHRSSGVTDWSHGFESNSALWFFSYPLPCRQATGLSLSCKFYCSSDNERANMLLNIKSTLPDQSVWPQGSSFHSFLAWPGLDQPETLPIGRQVSCRHTEAHSIFQCFSEQYWQSNLHRVVYKTLGGGKWNKAIKDGAYYCYCAYVLRISRYSDFLSLMLTNTGIFLRGLKLSRESRS